MTIAIAGTAILIGIGVFCLAYVVGMMITERRQ